ncbi:MAG: hypothetical protein JWL85_649 [Candidatus Saccharibacteria bacterium]|nr:hypothetical protein [Candidatus Saccharibacteria bacterium]
MSQSSSQQERRGAAQSIFGVAYQQFRLAERLMVSSPELSLIISTGEFERIILQQTDQRCCRVVLDRLAAIRDEDAVVVRIDVQEEYESRSGPVRKYWLSNSYVAYDDEIGTVLKLEEIDNMLCTREIKPGEKRDLFKNIHDGFLMIVD